MQIVQIVNLTQGTVIAQRAQIATALSQRIKGLLGRANLPENEALILTPCASIHTLFMRFPIDVLFLDKKMRIIKLIQKMPPFRLSPTVWGSQMTIELPAGRISQINIHLGDLIEIKP